MPSTTTYADCTACCGGGISTDCCPLTGVPSTLHVTFHNVSGCPCLDGLTVALTWVDASTQWRGNVPSQSLCGAGTDTFIFLRCGVLTWVMNFLGGGSVSPFSVSCGPPFAATFNGLDPFFIPCGGASVNATVTT